MDEATTTRDAEEVAEPEEKTREDDEDHEVHGVSEPTVFPESMDEAERDAEEVAEPEEKTSEDDEEDHDQGETACHTCAPGDACFDDVMWAMEVGIPSHQYVQGGWMPAVNEASCFEEVQEALKAWQSQPGFPSGFSHRGHFPAPCKTSAERHNAYGLVFCR